MRVVQLMDIEDDTYIGLVETNLTDEEITKAIRMECNDDLDYFEKLDLYVENTCSDKCCTRTYVEELKV